MEKFIKIAWLPGPLYAIAASENSADTVGFMKVNSAEDVAENNRIDDYGKILSSKVRRKTHRKNIPKSKETRKIAYIHKPSIA